MEMNPTAKALELVEPLLETRHWARVISLGEHVYFEAGPIHDNGFEECPTHSGTVMTDGRVVVSQHRI